eukprot:5618792-Amphidinium_carterae.1
MPEAPPPDVVGFSALAETASDKSTTVNVLAKIVKTVPSGLLCVDPHGVQQFVSFGGKNISSCYNFEVGTTLCLHRLWLGASSRCIRLYNTGGIESIDASDFEAASG